MAVHCILFSVALCCSLQVCQHIDIEGGQVDVGFGLGKYTAGNLACSVVSTTGGTYVFNMQYLNGENGR